MEKGARVSHKNEHAYASTEMRISSQGKVGNYLVYGNAMVDSDGFVVIKATGGALTKAITVAELLKRRHRVLHQITEVETIQFFDDSREDVPPAEDQDHQEDEGGQQVNKGERRWKAAITIHLSKTPLDSTHVGYQPPLEISEGTQHTTSSSAVNNNHNNNNNNSQRRPFRFHPTSRTSPSHQQQQQHQRGQRPPHPPHPTHSQSPQRPQHNHHHHRQEEGDVDVQQPHWRDRPQSQQHRQQQPRAPRVHYQNEHHQHHHHHHHQQQQQQHHHQQRSSPFFSRGGGRRREEYHVHHEHHQYQHQDQRGGEGGPNSFSSDDQTGGASYGNNKNTRRERFGPNNGSRNFNHRERKY